MGGRGSRRKTGGGEAERDTRGDAKLAEGKSRQGGRRIGERLERVNNLCATTRAREIKRHGAKPCGGGARGADGIWSGDDGGGWGPGDGG